MTKSNETIADTKKWNRTPWTFLRKWEGTSWTLFRDEEGEKTLSETDSKEAFSWILSETYNEVVTSLTLSKTNCCKVFSHIFSETQDGSCILLDRQWCGADARCQSSLMLKLKLHIHLHRDNEQSYSCRCEADRRHWPSLMGGAKMTYWPSQML